MKSLSELLTELADKNIKIWPDGDKLRCSGPDRFMNAELRAELGSRKAELLEFLTKLKSPEVLSEGDLRPISRGVNLPLSHGQERIWSLVEMQPQTSVYNISTAFRLAGSVDVASLERSLSELRRRHEILRTIFPAEDGKPRQLIHASEPMILPVTDVARDLGMLAPERREPEIRRLVESEVQRPFDLKTGPLWRPRLFGLAKNDHVLSLTMHHIIFDGRSKYVFLKELAESYRAFSRGGSPQVAELAIQYADFAFWQRRQLQGEVIERQFDYWKKRLSGSVGELRLATDHPRPKIATSRGANRSFELSEALAGATASLNRQEQASSFMTLLAGFCALLNRYTGQEDLLVCSPFAARDRAELEGLIGYINNVVPLRVDLSGDPGFRELIGRVRRVALEASDHQNLPLQKLAELPGLAHAPLNRAMFSFQETSSRTLDLPGVAATPIDVRKETADFDLALYMESAAGKLFGVLEYNAELFEGETIKRMVENFTVVLQAATANPERRLSQLPRFGRDS